MLWRVWWLGSARADSIFSVELDFVFDDATVQEAADLSLTLPDVTGEVVYDVDNAEPNGSGGFLLTPDNGGLQVLDVLVDSPFGVALLIEEDDVDFPLFPEAVIDAADNRVTGLDFQVEVDGVSASIDGDAFFGDAEFFVIDGSGTVVFGDPVLLSEPTLPSMDDGDDSETPEVIPRPLAAAGGAHGPDRSPPAERSGPHHLGTEDRQTEPFGYPAHRSAVSRGCLRLMGVPRVRRLAN
ncbi:MAG: hypothetical protein AAFX76_03685 [Planctomycetota bacterium]